MIRKITLLLALLLGIVVESTGTNKQTAVFKGDLSTGEWSSYVSLDKNVFANSKEGDIFYVKWTLDTEAAIAKDGSEENAYYQFNISFNYSDWSDKLVANTDVKYTASHYAHILTADEVNKLKTYGIAISARFLKITDVVFGDQFSQYDLQYWSDDKWNSASTTNFEMPNTPGQWASCVLNGETVKSANIGDRLTVTFTAGSKNLWDSQLQIIDASNSGWTSLMGIPVGGLNNMSLIVDKDVYLAFSRGDIRLTGLNLTITNIQLETTSLYYRLSANGNYADITKLPTSSPVNIELYRKYDWYTTICVPFNITDLSVFDHSPKAYEFKAKDSESTDLVFTRATSIEAGKPYLMTFDMSGIDDKTMTKTFEGVTINTTPNNTSADGITFKGNYKSGMEMDNNYGIACKQHEGNWDWGFYKGGSNSTLPAFSAYIVSSTSSSRGFSISTDDGTTRIDTFKNNEEVKDGSIYNLMGQKTNASGKGIYIKNGKKYIAK